MEKRTLSDRAVTVIGTNLYAVAAAQLGDATAWTVIAAVNGITDPMIDSLQTLIIPDDRSS